MANASLNLTYVYLEMVERVTSLPPPPSSFPVAFTPLVDPSGRPEVSWWQVLMRPKGDLIAVQGDVPFILIFGYKGDLSCKIVDLHRSFVNNFPVQVRTLAGKEFQVFVASWNLVLDLKRKIQEVDGKGAL
eukprot:1155874-Pelagomonas_calceolata.AAC.2